MQGHFIDGSWKIFEEIDLLPYFISRGEHPIDQIYRIFIDVLAVFVLLLLLLGEFVLDSIRMQG
jgi:hypothetical protein